MLILSHDPFRRGGKYLRADLRLASILCIHGVYNVSETVVVLFPTGILSLEILAGLARFASQQKMGRGAAA